MIRRQLFLGLTLVLLIVLAFLIMRGRRAERQQAEQSADTFEMPIEEAPMSPTRVLTPKELNIERAETSWTRGSGEENAGVSAQHELEIRNMGDVSYKSLRIKADYLDKKGKSLATRIVAIDKSVPHGETLTILGVTAENLPAAAVDCRVTIVSADIAAAQ